MAVTPGRGGTGACLADDMGLGKTVQALAVLLERARRGPALVLAPTSVVPNWLAEAERFAPKLGRVLYRGADREGLLRGIKAGDLVVTSYAIATRDAEALAAIPFATLIIDEAQALKNALARRTHAVKISPRGLAAGAHRHADREPPRRAVEPLRVLIAGPARWLRATFASASLQPIERNKDDAPAAGPLREPIRPFILRRTKDAVAQELPAKTEVIRTRRARPRAAPSSTTRPARQRSPRSPRSRRRTESDREGKRRFRSSPPDEAAPVSLRSAAVGDRRAAAPSWRRSQSCSSS